MVSPPLVESSPVPTASPPLVESSPVPTASPPVDESSPEAVTAKPLVEVEVSVVDSNPAEAMASADTAPSTASDEVVVAVPVDVEVTVEPLIFFAETTTPA